LSTFAFAVTHIETTLELANMIRPTAIPLSFIIRSANIIDTIFKKNKDFSNTKLMTLVLTQAYTLLDVATSRNSFEGKIRKYFIIIFIIFY